MEKVHLLFNQLLWSYFNDHVKIVCQDNLPWLLKIHILGDLQDKDFTEEEVAILFKILESPLDLYAVELMPKESLYKFIAYFLQLEDSELDKNLLEAILKSHGIDDSIECNSIWEAYSF